MVQKTLKLKFSETTFQNGHFSINNPLLIVT